MKFVTSVTSKSRTVGQYLECFDTRMVDTIVENSLCQFTGDTSDKIGGLL